jgi:phosphate acetyltransferase
MKTVFYLVPAGRSQGLTTVSLGLVRALDRRGVRVGFFKPINENAEAPEPSVHFLRSITKLTAKDPIPLNEVGLLMSTGRSDELLSRVFETFHESTDPHGVVITEGLTTSGEDFSREFLNQEFIKGLNAQVLLVISLAGRTENEIEGNIQFAAKLYGPARIAGLILNRVRPGQTDWFKAGKPSLPVIGKIPQNPELTYVRAVDVQRHLKAEILHPGEMASRRVRSTSLLARTVPNMLHTFTNGSMLVTPADRSDVIIAVSMAALSKVPLAGLVLTGETQPEQHVLDFCSSAFETGLPVLRVATDSYGTATALYQLSPEVPPDDLERIQLATNHVAYHIDVEWLIARSKVVTEVRLSPAAFLYQLAERARAADKTIVLPEGNEPRTVRAASICVHRRIANCILLGDPKEIAKAAQSQGVHLGENITIIDPAAVRSSYVDSLHRLRKHKGLSREMAASQLEDNVMLGTMMLAENEVDGLVSGAVHSTAHTIRPALQILKTKDHARVVSSIFFMCLPEQVLVYGDCAVIPDPDSLTLADIAIQSAESALAFGIQPRVALISYSTGESGSGSDVEKVREATRLAQKTRPDLLIDGPLQYDAASIPEVAKTKAPNSEVAGRATVFIFPDLNTGNTTYKAVQRSANVVSIGPMLQGLKKPVNDLSRGALVEDIVYTIALTAIQATQEEIHPGGHGEPRR